MYNIVNLGADYLLKYDDCQPRLPHTLANLLVDKLDYNEVLDPVWSDFSAQSTCLGKSQVILDDRIASLCQ